MAQPCRLIELSGTPHERGIQYGRQAAREIANAVGHYGAQAAALGVDADRLARMVREYLPVLENFDPGQVEEMHGIASGAASVSSRSCWSMHGPSCCFNSAHRRSRRWMHRRRQCGPRRLATDS